MPAWLVFEHLLALAITQTARVAWRTCVYDGIPTPGYAEFARAARALPLQLRIAINGLRREVLRVPAQTGTMRPGDFEQAFELWEWDRWQQSSSTAPCAPGTTA